MKKYIAFVTGGKGQNSGIGTLSEVTNWARDRVAQNSGKVFITEIISVAARPLPTVAITPFIPVTEITMTHGA